MASERLQRQIERLLDEAEDAVILRDWNVVLERARNVLILDPSNPEGRAFLDAADRALADSVSPPIFEPQNAPSADPQQTSQAHPFSFPEKVTDENIRTVLEALDLQSEDDRLAAIKLLAWSDQALLINEGVSLIPRMFRILRMRDEYGNAKAWYDGTSVVRKIAGVPGVLTQVLKELEHGQIEDRLAALDILNGLAAGSRNEVVPKPPNATPDELANVPGARDRVSQEAQILFRDVRMAFSDNQKLTAPGILKEAIPKVITATRDKNAVLRFRAFCFLAEIGPEVGVIHALIDGLSHKTACYDAVWALSSGRFNPETVGPEAKRAAPLLVALLNKSVQWDPMRSGMVRRDSIRALANIGPHAVASLPDIIREVKRNKDASLIEVFGNMGDDRDVVEALVQMFKFVNRGSPAHPAGRALAKIGPKPLVIQRLISGLKDENHLVRAGIADALG